MRVVEIRSESEWQRLQSAWDGLLRDSRCRCIQRLQLGLKAHRDNYAEFADSKSLVFRWYFRSRRLSRLNQQVF